MSQFTKMVRFEPGHDCIRFECLHGRATCKPGLGGSHGVGSMTIRFVLKGDLGAVQFSLYTGDWLPEPPSYEDGPLRDHRRLYGPTPSDLGYHSLKPEYEGQTTVGPCEFLGGAECFYDGSGLNAYEPFRVLCNEGDAALWEFLEGYYRCRFWGADFPKGKPYKHQRRLP